MSRILITGFGPFPGRPENPSAELVKILSDEKDVRLPPQAREIFARVLPTEFAAGLAEFRAALEECQPDIVICFGVAARTPFMRLERTARNVVDTALVDANGVHNVTGVVSVGGAESYPGGLPLAAMRDVIAAQGMPVEFSDDAGGYVCNYIFYHLMKAIAEEAPGVTGGFVHVPDPEVSGIALARVVDAAASIVGVCVDNVTARLKPRPPSGSAPFQL